MNDVDGPSQRCVKIGMFENREFGQLLFVLLRSYKQVTIIIGVLVEHHDAVRSARQNKCLTEFLHAAPITKDAACLDGIPVDIDHSPRSPQLLHVVASSSSSSKGLPSTLKRNSLPTLK